mgnify:CR=1 FL=1
MKMEIWWMKRATSLTGMAIGIDENGYLLNSDGSYQINANGEYIKIC